MLKWRGFILFLVWNQVVLAQNINPFDISSRSGAEITPVEIVTIPSEELPLEKNPFEIVRATKAVSANTPPSRVIEPPILSIKPATVVEDAKDVPRMFGIALLSLLPLAFLFAAFRPFFVKAYINVVSPTRLGQSLRDVNSIALIANTLWYVAAIVNIGIFLALVLRYYKISITSNIFF